MEMNDTNDSNASNASDISVNSNISEDMVSEQWICDICLSLKIRPVTLPCGHDLCLDCFRKSKDVVNLLCPFCRQRFSCWARKAKDCDNNLIDWQKWQLIQKQFPDWSQMQTTGHEMSENPFLDELEDQLMAGRAVHRVISSSGEIHKEWQQLLEKEREIKLAEEEATQRLIEKLLAEEQAPQRAVIDISMTINDEEIARSLQALESNDKTLRNRTVFND